MSTLRYIVKRLLKGAVVVLALVVLNFLLIHLAPGDPASVLAGEAGAGDQAYVEQLRKEFQLDEPLFVQLGAYLHGVVRLDLGFSYWQQRPVWDLIAERLPATLLLTASAFVFAIAVGIALGTLAATRIGTWFDTAVSGAALVLYATPLFWLGLMSILLFSVILNWVPAYGMETIGARYTGIDRVVDVGRHLVLPTVTLSSFSLAVYVRLIRASILEVASQDFVITARAKGVGEGRIVMAHVLRNALLPVVTFAGIQAGNLVSGAVLTETVFAWPGIGRLAFDALLQRDYNLLLGILLVSSIVVVLFNLVTDLIYSIVDPRVDLQQ